MTAEQKAEMERKGLEEAKLKESMAEKTPDWKLYCCMKQTDFNEKYWTDLIETAFEASAGDEADRWEALRDGFAMPQELDVIEEYDGMNHEEAKQMLLVISMPLLVRGHSIVSRVYEDIISVRVPHIYRVQLGLPSAIQENSCKSYFDCKLRKLFITMPVRMPEPEVVEEIEIETSEVRNEEAEAAPQAQESAADDLLFDVM